MTQDVIDNKVVHQTISAFREVGAALIVFMPFTSGMTGLRQYLELHTGNRIDAGPTHATAPSRAKRSYQVVPLGQGRLFCWVMVVCSRLLWLQRCAKECL